MSDDLCKCGHPKERHLFGEGHCLWQRGHAIHEGSKFCHCPGYEARIQESPLAKTDPDLLRGDIA